MLFVRTRRPCCCVVPEPCVGLASAWAALKEPTRSHRQSPVCCIPTSAPKSRRKRARSGAFIEHLRLSWLRGGGVAKEGRMADDVSDEPPVGDARTSWLPAPSAQFSLSASAARQETLRTKMPGKSCSRPRRRSRSKVRSDGACARRCRSRLLPALDAAEAIDAVLPTSKNAAVTRGRQDRTELILIDGVVALASQEPVDGDAKSRAARKTWVPTPLVLQRCPHILRQVAVHAPVAHGPLKRGADLYAGGVAVRSRDAGDGGIVARGAWRPHRPGRAGCGLCARFVAPVAVGRFSKSSEDMVLEGRGACVGTAQSRRRRLAQHGRGRRRRRRARPNLRRAAAAAAGRGGRALGRGAPRRADRGGGGGRARGRGPRPQGADEAPRQVAPPGRGPARAGAQGRRAAPRPRAGRARSGARLRRGPARGAPARGRRRGRVDGVAETAGEGAAERRTRPQRR